MISGIKTLGKYLDQPLLVENYKKAVAPIFISGATVYGANEIRKAPQEKKKETAIRTASVLTATTVSSLYAPKLSAKILRLPYQKYRTAEIIKNNTQSVDSFVKSATEEGHNLSNEGLNLLEKAKSKVLKFKEVKTLNNELSQTPKGKKLFNKLIPEPDNITAKDIKNEIGRLSLYGFIPIVGGTAGGITGDVLTEKKVDKDKMADRVKEGSYQYLANIFLCNVGAGLALAGLEKMNIKSKAARVVGMVTGIVATGIVGGSKIANFIGRNFINPIFDKGQKSKQDERKPEALDICLHSDDIATIAVMSGLKWIEPALPILYGISGYRTGIGYRNDKKNNANTENNVNSKTNSNTTVKNEKN